VSGGEREADRCADRLTNQQHTPEIQRVEKSFDGVGEISRGVLDLWRRGAAVAWKIGRDNLEIRAQRTHQRKEVFELRPQGVQEDDCRASTSPQEAELAPENIDALRIQAAQHDRDCLVSFSRSSKRRS
jgi:hypothetical protein